MLFACIFVPDFAAEALVRAEPELRDAAVAVVEGKPPLLSVVAANERARQAGVECGMTNVQAAARLNAVATAANPGVIRRRSLSQEVAAHAALADCARAFSPRVEEYAAAPDTVLLDLHGLERLFGTPRKIACELVRRASDLGLEANVAVSAHLDTAICAARGFGGTTVIPKGKEAERLAPLPIEVLLQVAAAHETDGSNHKSVQLTRKSSAKKVAKDKPDTERALEILDTLDRWGVRTFRAFATIPEIAAAERLGPEGVYLHTLCRGESTRTLVPTDRPLNFEEAIELEYPVDDLEPLAFILSRLLEQLCARLTARALSTNELRLRMELEHCGDYEIARSQSAVSADKEPAIYERALHLPVPMLDAKVFLRLWQLELRAKPPVAAITRVWLRAEPVQPRNTQGGLFLPAAPEPERLELTLARIAAVVGDQGNGGESNADDTAAGAVKKKSSGPFDPGSRFVRSTHTVTKPPLKEMVPLEKTEQQTRKSETAKDSSRSAIVQADSSLRVGTPEIVDTYRPDTLRMRRFRAPSAESALATGTPKKTEAQDESTTTGVQSMTGITALRLFRPPLAANVDVIDGRPTWLHAVLNHDTQMLSGEVAWCAGPWRASGEWWNQSWSREEWDVAVEADSGRVLCRVFRDEQQRSWFVEGIYD